MLMVNQLIGFGAGGPVRTGFTADLIPLMTSDTAPSGTASASTFYSASTAAWKAMDNDNTTHWLTNATTTGWLRYQFTAAKTIEQYTILVNNANLSLPRGPKSWTFEGSNDGTNWTVLDTQTNQTHVDNVASVYNSFVNTTSYTYYRLNITANNGDASYVGVSEWQMMEGVYS